MNVSHHDLGLGGVGQKGNAAGGFDLIDDPVPVSDGLERNGCAFRELREEGFDSARDVADPSLLDQVSPLIKGSKKREMFVGIATDRIIRLNHAAPPVG